MRLFYSNCVAQKVPDATHVFRIRQNMRVKIKRSSIKILSLTKWLLIQAFSGSILYKDNRWISYKSIALSIGKRGPPQFNTSVSLKRATSFQPQNPSVPHQQPLGSTPKIPQFHTKNRSVPTERVFGVELRGFWCWTEGFWVLNWGIPGAEKVWSLCGTNVLNWGGLCGTERYSVKVIN